VSTPAWSKQAQGLLPGLVVLGVISLASIGFVQMLGGVSRMRELVATAGVWAPLVFIFLKVLTYVIAPLSGAPLTLMAGAVFGVNEGFGLIVLGEMLGAGSNFWIARVLGRPGIRRFGGIRTIRKVDKAVSHVGGWRALLVASVFFSPLYDFISYAAGLSNISYNVFFWVSLVGIIPMAAIWVTVGDRLTSGYGVVLVLTGAAAIGGLWWWFKMRKRA